MALAGAPHRRAPGGADAGQESESPRDLLCGSREKCEPRRSIILGCEPALAQPQMSQEGSTRLTMLIAELRQGNDQAREELVTLVYPELRRIAGVRDRRG